MYARLFAESRAKELRRPKNSSFFRPDSPCQIPLVFRGTGRANTIYQQSHSSRGRITGRRDGFRCIRNRALQARS